MAIVENASGKQSDGWVYHGEPEPNSDARKLVTLVLNGMTWVGIRYWNFQQHHWFNNNEPETATVKAWRDLDEPAKGFWQRGQLHISERHHGRYQTGESSKHGL